MLNFFALPLFRCYQHRQRFASFKVLVGNCRTCKFLGCTSIIMCSVFNNQICEEATHSISFSLSTVPTTVCMHLALTVYTFILMQLSSRPPRSLHFSCIHKLNQQTPFWIQNVSKKKAKNCCGSFSDFYWARTVEFEFVRLLKSPWLCWNNCPSFAGLLADTWYNDWHHENVKFDRKLEFFGIKCINRVRSKFCVLSCVPSSHK